jgi:Domain of unknown function (DUF4331)
VTRSKKRRLTVAAPLAIAALAATAAIPAFAPASSHREAPAISQDPTADSTDVYAFRSPDDGKGSTTATIIGNWIPMEEPAAGPNFYRFSDSARYELKVDNTGDGYEDITYRLEFKTKTVNPESFLYNTGPVTYNAAEKRYDNLNVVQTYTIKKLTRGKGGKWYVKTIGKNLLTPPNNVGPRSTPNYASALVPPAVHTLSDGTKVFAGQRDDPFFADLGGVFDLVGFRQSPPNFTGGGDDALTGFNVHTIALQVPVQHLTKKKNVPSNAQSTDSVIGVYAATSRPSIDSKGRGVWKQVSRLGFPLVNEVIIPLGQKDMWNASRPADDAQFEGRYLKPELAGALNGLYNIGAPTDNRTDLALAFLQGIPPGLGVPTTQIGSKPAKADLLRLNLAVPPTTGAQNRIGLLAGDADGFPNGRRLGDDVIDVAERAVAGAIPATFPNVFPNITPSPAAGALGDGVETNDLPFLAQFPYVPNPVAGFDKQHPRPSTFPTP